MKIASLLLAASFSAQAQLALFSFNGTTETPVGSTYNFGTVSSGGPQSATFHARNTGNSAVTVSTLSVSGAGFTIAVNGPLPYTVAPSNYLGFTVQFSASVAASYSASLQVNTIDVLLLATSVPAPTLAPIPPPALTGIAAACTTAGAGFAFTSVQIGSQGLCNFSLQNPNSQPIVISSISVGGDAAFQLTQAPPTPFTLAPNTATAFVVQFQPRCGTATYAGSLTVNSQSSPLSGSGLTPLPNAAFAVNGAASSAHQPSLTMSLAAPAVCAASGNVNLAFKPNPGLADDSEIAFLAGSTRTLQYTVTANSTQVSIAGQTSAMFQTGTTAGTITFTASGTNNSVTTTLTIAPAPIVIDTATASNQITGQLNVEVVGYDNTYSAGPMSFTFLDANGKPIGSAVSADFSSNFQSYFTTAPVAGSGSAFLIRVSFPVTGNASEVVSVQATLGNSAGQAQTGTLTFQ